MKTKNIFWGLLFIIAAALVIAGQFGFLGGISIWTLAATCLLAITLIQSIVHKNFYGIFIPIALLYFLYQKTLALPHVSVWALLGAALLISIGFSILFKQRPPAWSHSYPPPINSSSASLSTSYESLGDTPYAKVNFGEGAKYIHSDNLQTGQFYSSFGSLEVFFDQAQINPNGADIYLDCNFGTIVLSVPKSWNVVNNAKAFCGNIDIPDKPADPYAPTLRLSGNVQFGYASIVFV